MTHFRLIALSATAMIAAWAGAALAQRPQAQSQVVRLEPGYGGVCEACNLRGRVLTGARMSRSVFNRTDFSYAMLARIDGEGSRFEGANFTAADLSNAKLSSARFSGARFEGANISGADFRDAEGLTQAQLNRACGDRQTRLPRGLRVHNCGGER